MEATGGGDGGDGSRGSGRRRSRSRGVGGGGECARAGGALAREEARAFARVEVPESDRVTVAVERGQNFVRHAPVGPEHHHSVEARVDLHEHECQCESKHERVRDNY